MSQEQLTQALQGLLDKYTMLVNSGDTGNWDPEEEPEVIAARAAISATQPAQAAQGESDVATWLWLRFADYCRNQGMNPHHQNDLFAIVHDLRAMLTSSPTPPAQQGEPT